MKCDRCHTLLDVDYVGWADAEERGVPKDIASGRRWRANNPQKALAHRIMAKALRRGELRRSEACSKCGRKGKVEGHHVDYSKPLDVVWLCSRCHHREHLALRNYLILESPTPSGS